MKEAIKASNLSKFHRSVMRLVRSLPKGTGPAMDIYIDYLMLRPQRKAATKFSAVLNCNIKDIVSRHIYLFGFWEPNITAIIEETLGDGDLFVDVGANIGYYTLLASRRVGRNGRVISIEAVPEIFAQLERNVAANGCDNVRLINCAVSSAVGEMAIYGAPEINRGMSSLINHEGWAAEAVVATAPLEHILNEEEIQRIKAIKIDIEGAEILVLEHFLETIDLYNSAVTLFVELSPYISGDAAYSMFDKIKHAGFDAYLIENDYDINWYLKWRHAKPPVQIATLPPGRQADIMFRRRAPQAQWRGHTKLLSDAPAPQAAAIPISEAAGHPLPKSITVPLC